MQKFLSLMLAGLATALPSPLTFRGEVTTFTPDQIHANALQSVDPKYVIQSADLHEYIKANAGANHTIYVADTRRFVNLATVEQKLSKRYDICFGYIQHYAQSSGSWWHAWEPASGCVYTGYDPSGASESINWSFSLSITETAGLDWGIIKDVLSASIGVSIAETWTHGEATTCIIPGNSVGQVWIQNHMAWGDMWSEGCQSCDFGGGCGGNFGYNPKSDGHADAPYDGFQQGSTHNLGCSTGSSKVSC